MTTARAHCRSLLPLLASLGASSGLAGRTSADAELSWSGGKLGQTLALQLDGDPLELYVLGFSFSAGPTPLALVDPLDPRSLALGLDLIAYWQSGVLGPAGTASLALNLPPNPVNQGLPFFLQFVTITGLTPTLVDDLSNPISLALGAPGSSTFAVGDAGDALVTHTATALVDGRVLLAGGASEVTSTALAGFRAFDPQTETFSAAGGAMQTARVLHSATRLSDGRVLLLGGNDATGATLSSGDVWDPVTETAAPIAPMGTPRTFHTATLLADGRVFVAGGVGAYDPADPSTLITNVLASSAIWNPATNSWAPGPNLPAPRVGHRATRMNDGRVLIAGGLEVPVIFGIPIPAVVSTCRIYAPATNSYQSAASFPGPRALHGQVLLPSGEVLLTGGLDATIDLIGQTVTTTILDSCRVYSPASNTWTSVGSLGQARVYHETVLAGAQLVTLGGLHATDALTGTGDAAETIEVSSTGLIAWTSPASMLLERAAVAVAVIDGGARVLTTGIGDDGDPLVPDESAELFLVP